MRPITVRVDNRIRVPIDGVDEQVLEKLRKACTHPNPAYAKKIALKFSTWGTPKTLCTWKDEGDALTLPRGAMKSVRQILKNAGIPVRYRDERVEGSILARPIAYVGHEPREYQHEAVRIALAKEQGIIRAATGTGKTTTALFLASQVGLNTLIIVPNKALLKQTMRVAEELLGLRGDRIGIIGGGKRRIRPITIAIQNSLWSSQVDEEVRDYFGCIIVDEGHHAAARTFSFVIDQFPARYRFAFSADERRNDRMECLVYDAFGDVLHETTREQAERMKAIVDVEVRIVPTDFRADWYVEEPDEDEGSNKDFKRLLDEMIVDKDRNDIIAEIVAEELDDGNSGIVLTHRRDHAFALDQALVGIGARCGRMLGGIGADAHEFDSTNLGLRNGDMNVGVGTYEALGEGIDLPAVEFGIASTHISNNKQRMNQVRGRLCRPSDGKVNGRLYVVYDRHVFGERSFANILAWNKTVKIKHRGKWVDARKFRRAIMAA